MSSVALDYSFAEMYAKRIIDISYSAKIAIKSKYRRVLLTSREQAMR